ncbi:MAG: hypothetical protein MUO85_03290, partial [candidate division Zixibacteria bacterium]|nr:hypothetical protein [candidate division Zixibacteria bacterium]
MKVILSRKGFDSAFGGYPSPILPSGEMISLPIPSYEDISYSDVKTGESTYYNLMKDLEPKIKSDDEWLDLNENIGCHLDPDIHKNSIDRVPGWRPCFGQDGAAQSHLENQGVSENDLFLFFGWFRKIRIYNGKREFDPHEKGKHAIFGYLQIGEIKKVDNEFDIPKWLAYHPHVAEERRNVEPDKT